jgi:hypothetical protein
LLPLPPVVIASCWLRGEGCVRGIRALVGELHAALVSFDPAGFSGGECAALAECLARLANACDAASVRAAGRAVECGVVRDGPDASPAEWLARVGGASAGAARAGLETLGRLDAYPATRDAVIAGDVSLAQAAQIVSLPEHEAELLALAWVSGLRAVKDTARERGLAGSNPPTSRRGNVPRGGSCTGKTRSG